MPVQTPLGEDFTDAEVNEITGQRAYELYVSVLPAEDRACLALMLRDGMSAEWITNHDGDSIPPNVKRTIIKGLDFYRDYVLRIQDTVASN